MESYLMIFFFQNVGKVVSNECTQWVGVVQLWSGVFKTFLNISDGALLLLVLKSFIIDVWQGFKCVFGFLTPREMDNTILNSTCQSIKFQLTIGRFQFIYSSTTNKTYADGQIEKLNCRLLGFLCFKII